MADVANSLILTKLLICFIVIISIIGFLLIISDEISGGLILLAIATIMGFASKQIRIHDKDSPVAVLEMRLAKGEITKEEYEELRKTLDR